jgi:2-iminobutanoate/2-iminopropanoate deaminase
LEYQFMVAKAPFTVITTPRHERMKRLPFVPAIKVRAESTLVFVSGMMGTPEDMAAGGPPTPPEDIRTEAERIFTRMRAILELSGASMQQVVKITKYMTDLDQHDAVVAVMREHFGDHLPTSTTVEVRRLVLPGFRLEIDAVAAMGVDGAPD